jgi:hypothetical protein
MKNSCYLSHFTFICSSTTGCSLTCMDPALDGVCQNNRSQFKCFTVYVPQSASFYMTHLWIRTNPNGHRKHFTFSTDAWPSNTQNTVFSSSYRHRHYQNVSQASYRPQITLQSEWPSTFITAEHKHPFRRCKDIGHRTDAKKYLKTLFFLTVVG